MSGFFLVKAESRRYMVGPTLDVRLPLHLGVEVDALYRTFGYSNESGGLLGAFANHRERSNSWEFPVIGKFHIPGGAIHPFVEAGFNSRLVREQRRSPVDR